MLQSCKTASILVYLKGNDCLTVCFADAEVNKLYERPVAATRGGGAPNLFGDASTAPAVLLDNLLVGRPGTCSIFPVVVAPWHRLIWTLKEIKLIL